MAYLPRLIIMVIIAGCLPISAFAATNDSLNSSNGHFYIGVPVRIPAATHLDQQGGHIRITFMGYEHFAADSRIASTSPLTQTLGRFLLDYSSCVDSFCPNSSHSTMVSELWPGQSTNYLGYQITLNGFFNGAVVTVRHAQ